MSNRILVIDDAADTHVLVRARLGKEQVEIISATDGSTGITMAVKESPHLILLDVDMPDRDGFAICADLKANPRTRDIPIIFLSGATAAVDKIRGLDLGATDYVTKPFDAAELQARVRATLRTGRLVELLAERAMIDGLTGLWNRTYLDAQVTMELAAARRTRAPLSCIMADIDHFKSINDNYGHAFGDDVLREVSSILTHQCRTEDIVCRYGGEEFTILLPNTSIGHASEMAERLRTAISNHAFSFRGQRVRVTGSFGVANLREQIPPSLIELADSALYSAKRSGRDRVVTFDSEEPVGACNSADGNSE
jgi:two-component system cell cycle response regulator